MESINEASATVSRVLEQVRLYVHRWLELADIVDFYARQKAATELGRDEPRSRYVAEQHAARLSEETTADAKVFARLFTAADDLRNSVNYRIMFGRAEDGRTLAQAGLICEKRKRAFDNAVAAVKGMEPIPKTNNEKFGMKFEAAKAG